MNLMRKRNLKFGIWRSCSLVSNVFLVLRYRLPAATAVRVRGKRTLLGSIIAGCGRIAISVTNITGPAVLLKGSAVDGGLLEKSTEDPS